MSKGRTLQALSLYCLAHSPFPLWGLWATAFSRCSPRSAVSNRLQSHSEICIVHTLPAGRCRAIYHAHHAFAMFA